MNYSETIKCDSCKKNKRFQSEIVIFGRLSKASMGKVRICHECRKKPIDTIYEILIKKWHGDNEK